MSEPDYIKDFSQLLRDADIDFRQDVSYAVAIANAARNVLAKKAKQVDRQS